jgi:hypothetical protein
MSKSDSQVCPIFELFYLLPPLIEGRSVLSQFLFAFASSTPRFDGVQELEYLSGDLNVQRPGSKCRS